MKPVVSIIWITFSFEYQSLKVITYKMYIGIFSFSIITWYIFLRSEQQGASFLWRVHPSCFSDSEVSVWFDLFSVNSPATGANSRLIISCATPSGESNHPVQGVCLRADDDGLAAADADVPEDPEVDDTGHDGGEDQQQEADEGLTVNADQHGERRVEGVVSVLLGWGRGGSWFRTSCTALWGRCRLGWLTYFSLVLRLIERTLNSNSI